jgi:hypothetical protein
MRCARSESFSLLSERPAHIESSITKFIRGFAAGWVFYNIPERNEFTQGPVGFFTLCFWLVHEGLFRKVRFFTALRLHAKTDKNRFLDGVYPFNILSC